MKQPPGSRVASCENCRRRKLRCDRQDPCDTCVVRGQSQSCSYARPQRRQFDKDFKVSMQDNLINSSLSMDVSSSQRSLLQGIDEFQQRLNQFRSSIIKNPPSSSSTTTTTAPFHDSNSQLPLLVDILGRDSIAMHAISLLPPLQEFQDSAAFYFRSYNIQFYSINEELFLQEFEQRHANISQVQSLLQKSLLDSGKMAEAYRIWQSISDDEYLVYLGLALAIHASSLTWGFEPAVHTKIAASSSSFTSKGNKIQPSKRQLQIASLIAACQQIYISIEPLLRPTINSLRLSICLITLTCIIKGAVRMVGLLGEASYLLSALSLDKEPPISMEPAIARDRLHLFVSVTVFDWVGRMTVKPYCVVVENGENHPLLFGDASTSNWANVMIDGTPLVTLRMRYKALLASTCRRTWEYLGRSSNIDEEIIRMDLDRRHRELDKCTPELVKETGHTEETAIAYTWVLKTYIEVQRLYLTRKPGHDKSKNLYNSAQSFLTLAADSLRSITTPQSDYHPSNRYIAGIRCTLIPHIWYAIQVTAITLMIVKKAKDSGLDTIDDAKAIKDNQLCSKVLEELERNGMGVSKAMPSKPFVKAFDEADDDIDRSSISEDTELPTRIMDSFATADDTFLSWPIMEDQEIMNLCMDLIGEKDLSSSIGLFPQ